jgi:hypothetical protein
MRPGPARRRWARRSLSPAVGGRHGRRRLGSAELLQHHDRRAVGEQHPVGVQRPQGAAAGQASELGEQQRHHARELLGRAEPARRRGLRDHPPHLLGIRELVGDVADAHRGRRGVDQDSQRDDLDREVPHGSLGRRFRGRARQVVRHHQPGAAERGHRDDRPAAARHERRAGRAHRRPPLRFVSSARPGPPALRRRPPGPGWMRPPPVRGTQAAPSPCGRRGHRPPIRVTNPRKTIDTPAKCTG